MAEPRAGQRLRDAPPQVLGLVLGVEFAAALLCGLALWRGDLSGSCWRCFGLLTLFCLVFEEISSQVGKLRMIVRTGPRPDMTSVWTFAGAFLLPAGLAAALVMVIAVIVWFRQQRATGQLVYRTVYFAATVMLAALTASAVASSEQALKTLPGELRHFVVLALAMAAYTLVQRVLIMAAVLASGGRLPDSLLGHWSDNALEIATLCLGVLMASVLLHDPAWSPTVLLPMVLLQRGALVSELEAAASTDGKTNLLNASAWEHLAERELAALKHERAPGAVLIIDLDHFKDVNDRLGHLVGDAALGLVGENLKAVLRHGDIVGRFGGEEFVALLPRIDVDLALHIAERVRAAIRAVPSNQFCPPDARGSQPASGVLSASIGVAIFPEHGGEIDELLRVADAALYHAKRSGRDRVTIADSGEPGERILPLP